MAMDIGNTNIKTAVFEGDKLLGSWRIATDITKTSDEYGLFLTSLYRYKFDEAMRVDGIIVSSVLPSVNYTIEHMCHDFFHINPTFVSADMDFGIQLDYKNPKELGTDRIANAVGAYNLYGGPCIYIDFGTATTYGAISGDGTFLGGAICPGLKLSIDALVQRASLLPRIELHTPDRVIGRDTVTNMQSGLVYGFVGQVNHIVHKMKMEMGEENAKVIATGGQAKMIASADGVIEILDSLLTLKGLHMIYERNK